MTRALLLVAIAATGCFGMKTYRSVPPRNLHVVTELESGVDATLQLFAVDAACATRDLGGLELPGAADLGVPAGQRTLLVVTFDTSSFWRGDRKIRVDTLLSPRAGAEYALSAKYAKDLYEVRLLELGRNGTSREVPHKPLSGCGAR